MENQYIVIVSGNYENHRCLKILDKHTYNDKKGRYPFSSTFEEALAVANDPNSGDIFDNWGTFFGPFRDRQEAKIWIAKQRVKYLKTFPDSQESCRGEREKTEKWLIQKAERYPEYFI